MKRSDEINKHIRNKEFLRALAILASMDKDATLTQYLRAKIYLMRSKNIQDKHSVLLYSNRDPLDYAQPGDATKAYQALFAAVAQDNGYFLLNEELPTREHSWELCRALLDEISLEDGSVVVTAEQKQSIIKALLSAPEGLGTANLSTFLHKHPQLHKALLRGHVKEVSESTPPHKIYRQLYKLKAFELLEAYLDHNPTFMQNMMQAVDSIFVNMYQDCANAASATLMIKTLRQLSDFDSKSIARYFVEAAIVRFADHDEIRNFVLRHFSREVSLISAFKRGEQVRHTLELLSHDEQQSLVVGSIEALPQHQDLLVQLAGVDTLWLERIEASIANKIQSSDEETVLGCVDLLIKLCRNYQQTDRTVPLLLQYLPVESSRSRRYYEVRDILEKMDDAGLAPIADMLLGSEEPLNIELLKLFDFRPKMLARLFNACSWRIELDVATLPVTMRYAYYIYDIDSYRQALSDNPGQIFMPPPGSYSMRMSDFFDARAELVEATLAALQGYNGMIDLTFFSDFKSALQGNQFQTFMDHVFSRGDASVEYLLEDVENQRVITVLKSSAQPYCFKVCLTTVQDGVYQTQTAYPIEVSRMRDGGTTVIDCDDDFAVTRVYVPAPSRQRQFDEVPLAVIHGQSCNLVRVNGNADLEAHLLAGQSNERQNRTGMGI